MTAKEYLEEVQRLQIIVEQFKIEKASFEKIQTLKIANQSTKNHCQSLIEEVNDKISEAFSEITIRTVQIRSLDNPLYTNILYQKYFLQRSIPEIADSLNYSLRHTFTLYSKALKAFESAYPTISNLPTMKGGDKNESEY